MRTFLPILIGLTVTTTITFTARWLLRRTNNRIWKIRIIDVFGLFLPYLTFLGVGMAMLSFRFKLAAITPLAMAIVSVFFVLSLILIGTLPFSLGVNFLTNFLNKYRQRQKPEVASADRRLFLKTAAAALPVIISSTTVSGFAGGFSKVRIPEIDLKIDFLPPELEGLRILHLSDLHLGYYFGLRDLEDLLTELDTHSFDLVLLTGDISDDVSQLETTLKMIDQLRTPYPKYISIGNHEFYRGLKEFISIVGKSPLRFLRNSGQTIPINGKDVFIGGADDPMHLRSDIADFMFQTTINTIEKAPNEAFKILMSHRPSALDPASAFGINLILAGHTHGGQIGFRRRSVFDNIVNEPYLWGQYKKENTLLYTSSGVGHWFPFRLGCPAEAPILTLKRNVSEASG